MRGMGEPRTRSELRKFGLTMALPLTLLGGLAWWRGSDLSTWLWGAAGVFLVMGLVLPGALRPVERAWMRLAWILSSIMTRVLLTLSFFLVITPFGWLLRLMGKDLLEIRIDRQRQSYWIPVELDGPATRPDKPY